MSIFCKGDKGIISMESSLVEHALDQMLTLPNAMNEVASHQRDQACTLLLLQKELASNEEKLDKGILVCPFLQYFKLLLVHFQINKVLGRVTMKGEEVSSLQRKILLTQEEAGRLSGSITEAQKENSSLLEEFCELEFEAKRLQQDLQDQHRIQKIYEVKMISHKNKVHKMEKVCDEFKALSKKEVDIRELQERQKELSNYSNYHDSMQEEIHHQKNMVVALRGKTDEIKSEIKHIDGERMKIMQEVEVLKKRNAAQLRRLKRQLNEVQGRKAQSTRQANQLQRRIEVLKHELSLRK
ncbi:hypothetical protein CAPTEDRAFT_202898 [Capitella teleta]|uniref:Uncharacterized protein n=1 Tax=Capitella teleta TaxID=283909 RepID=R7U1J0_CAPTE|nr:hypothetical protein CAPTEDRAFT_202898 [Capitella teleta]|eukprot:ELT97531.1 hypothetical protein CAPTEDRAFT_202898 [Capitella teleta]